jgi:hypothetical protein
MNLNLIVKVQQFLSTKVKTLRTQNVFSLFHIEANASFFMLLLPLLWLIFLTFLIKYFSHQESHFVETRFIPYSAPEISTLQTREQLLKSNTTQSATWPQHAPT